MPKLLFIPVCAQGDDLLGPIHFWVRSRRNCGTKLAPCVYTPKTTLAKRTITKCFISKWQPKNEFSFHEKSHVTKIEEKKTTFPRRNFLIKFGSKFTFFEIKFEKKREYSVEKCRPKSFVTLRNNAHLC